MANNYAICQEAADIASISVSQIGVPANSFVTKSVLISTGKFLLAPLENYSNNEFVKLIDIKVGNIPVTGIRAIPSSMTLIEGDSDNVVAVFTPAEATNKGVTFVSSVPSKASVNNSGRVTAISTGRTVITLTSNDGGFKANCEVIVTGVSAPVTFKAILDPSSRTRGTVQINNSTPVATELTLTVEKGDNVTFKCNKNNGLDVFDGWYNGITKVSNDLVYTFVATSATTLTAKILYLEIINSNNRVFDDTGKEIPTSEPIIINTNTNWNIT